MIKAEQFARELQLKTLSPSTVTEWEIDNADINRPGLQLVGFFDYFAHKRPQVFGKVEMTYLESLDAQTLKTRLVAFFEFALPCIIICRGMQPPEILLSIAQSHNVAVYGSDLTTTKFSMNAVNFLARQLAPRSNVHGVLMDVYGIGILIMGDSGVGKSEAALELVKRGHQLVADDVVQVCRVTDNRLTGEAPETIRHFMEIRGLGIIDIRAMYGISAVMRTKSIDLVIYLEEWDGNKNYERLGFTEEYTTIMDVRVPKLLLPVRHGRNLAVIIEVAARNFSLKRFGYSAAMELDRRLHHMISDIDENTDSQDHKPNGGNQNDLYRD